MEQNILPPANHLAQERRKNRYENMSGEDFKEKIISIISNIYKKLGKKPLSLNSNELSSKAFCYQYSHLIVNFLQKMGLKATEVYYHNQAGTPYITYHVFSCVYHNKKDIM